MSTTAVALRRIVLEDAILAPEVGLQLNIPARAQQMYNWCWAACMEMATHYFNYNPRYQCAFACARSGRNDCCTGWVNACDLPATMAQVSAIFQLNQYGMNWYAAPFSLQDVAIQINNGRPLELGLNWYAGGGHMVLAIGWMTDAGNSFVLVNDPWSGAQWVNYNNLLNAYGLGVWAETMVHVSIGAEVGNVKE